MKENLSEPLEFEPCEILLRQRDSGGWEFAAHLGDFGCDSFQCRLVVDVCDCGVDPLRYLAHLRVAHSARRDRRCAESDPARAERFARIVGNRVVVADDACGLERFRSFFADHFLVGQIDQDKMVVSSA